MNNCIRFDDCCEKIWFICIYVEVRDKDNIMRRCALVYPIIFRTAKVGTSYRSNCPNVIFQFSRFFIQLFNFNDFCHFFDTKLKLLLPTVKSIWLWHLAIVTRFSQTSNSKRKPDQPLAPFSATYVTNSFSPKRAPNSKRTIFFSSLHKDNCEKQLATWDYFEGLSNLFSLRKQKLEYFESRAGAPRRLFSSEPSQRYKLSWAFKQLFLFIVIEMQLLYLLQLFVAVTGGILQALKLNEINLVIVDSIDSNYWTNNCNCYS